MEDYRDKLNNLSPEFDLDDLADFPDESDEISETAENVISEGTL